MQPFGWGVAAHLRLHFARVLKSRFGFEVHAGHTRWQQRQNFDPLVVSGGESTVTRITLLTHNDFGAGPSFEIPIGAVFLQIAATGGVAVSTLARPISADSREDLLISDVDGLIRGGLAVGIPIMNRHGLTIGSEVVQVFSNREIAANPLSDPDGAQVVPFSTWMSVYGAYTIWF
ncbi:MAG: hypothetical protein HC927_05525 [Deltaproteobacteria bacterium]|nr:hypothetical protein [Deltaproteobacteria bacterium]